MIIAQEEKRQDRKKRLISITLSKERPFSF